MNPRFGWFFDLPKSLRRWIRTVPIVMFQLVGSNAFWGLTYSPQGPSKSKTVLRCVEGGGEGDAFTHIDRLTDTYLHAYMHTYMHTYIHTYIHT